MKLAVIATEKAKESLTSGLDNDSMTCVFVSEPADLPQDCDAVLDLLFNGEAERMETLARFLPKPVLVNAVAFTGTDLQHPFIRMNGWPGFIEKPVWEMVVPKEQEPALVLLMQKMKRHYINVPDAIGMVSARIIAMIINEAFFAWGEGVSSQEEIDLAMKWGTNYPMGPFEWCRQIGMPAVYDLLERLSKTNKLYEPAPALVQAIKTKDHT